MSDILRKKGVLKFFTLGVFLATMYSIILGADLRRNIFYDEYIDKHKKLAITHMKKYNVPASIILAQGLLESEAGRSSLTTKSNNHFGIKCKNDWQGERVIAADDTPNDCFRKYKNVEDSYEDHSRFLVERSRYNSLFSLDITDYKSWAKGLQKAGYATDRAYANKLIKVIEDYELYKYDRDGFNRDQNYSLQTLVNTKTTPPPSSSPPPSSPPLSKTRHTPYKTNGLVYVIAYRGDSYRAIAQEFGFNVAELCKYNEVPQNFPLEAGDIVYFEKKHKKADKPYYEHVVRVGDSMYRISQLYGMVVENLYEMNKKDFSYVPMVGDILRLR